MVKWKMKSADVKASYPSFDIDFTVEKLREVFYNNGIKIECTDVDEPGLYLAIYYNESQLKEKLKELFSNEKIA